MEGMSTAAPGTPSGGMSANDIYRIMYQNAYAQMNMPGMQEAAYGQNTLRYLQAIAAMAQMLDMTRGAGPFSSMVGPRELIGRRMLQNLGVPSNAMEWDQRVTPRGSTPRFQRSRLIDNPSMLPAVMAYAQEADRLRGRMEDRYNRQNVFDWAEGVKSSRPRWWGELDNMTPWQQVSVLRNEWTPEYKPSQDPFMDDPKARAAFDTAIRTRTSPEITSDYGLYR